MGASGTIESVATRLCPGSVLSLKGAPEAGLWTVVSLEIKRYPGPWEQLHMLLLGRSMLKELDVEKGSFLEQWDVVHNP